MVLERLEIGKTISGENLIISNEIWIEDNKNTVKYVAIKRIGIGYASKKDQDRLWRFKIVD